jgi:hypothetical protein
MAATTKVKDFIWRVSSALNDSSTQYVTWLESEIVMAINDGQVAICKYIPFSCTRTDTVLLAPGTMQSIRAIPTTSIIPTVDSATPTTTVYGRQLSHLDCNMGAAGTAPGKIIRVTDRDELDTIDPSWHTKTGTEVRVYAYDPTTPTVFYVSPGVPPSGLYVRMSYAALPAVVAPGNDTTPVYAYTGSNAALLSIDDVNVDDLMNYVLARMNMKDDSNAKPALVATQVNSFVNSINAQATALTGVNPNLKRLPMAPDAIGSAS